MATPEKVAAVAELAENFRGSNAVLITEYRGLSVKQLASDLGYASVPAFSHAFRQVTGKTPTEFAGKE